MVSLDSNANIFPLLQIAIITLNVPENLIHLVSFDCPFVIQE